MQLYFKLKLSNHPAVSINRARAQIVIARKIIACEWQKIWDSMPLRRLYIRHVPFCGGIEMATCVTYRHDLVHFGDRVSP
jgi:NADH:ubiquinone oxidoreductase subunit B-like Fe-S oxidoreductase